MRQILQIALPVILCATAATAGDPVFKPPPPADGHAYPDCFCTNRGERVPIGSMSCLRIGSQEFTARCGMSLNNPAWRDLEEGCQTPMSKKLPYSEPLEPV
ncbi:MAG: hypothetical protein ACPGGK_07815 [Pikeienuella sp.]